MANRRIQVRNHQLITLADGEEIEIIEYAEPFTRDIRGTWVSGSVQAGIGDVNTQDVLSADHAALAAAGDKFLLTVNIGSRNLYLQGTGVIKIEY